MNCPNCNKKIKDNEKICKKCQEKELNDLKKFIGKNQKNIINQKISLYALLFGPFYTLYRKIYSESIILILLYLVTTIYLDSNFDILLKLTINLFLALAFRKMYLTHARNKINKLREEENYQNLINKSGGTLHIHSIIAVFIMFIGIVMLFNNTDSFKVNNTVKEKITNNTIQNLTYTLPTNVNVKENESNYQYYIYKENNQSCFIIISTTPKYNDEVEYLIEKKESYNNYDDKTISTESINNIEWKVLKSDNKKEDYTIKHKDNIYELSFEAQNIKYCNYSKETILNSVKLN